MFGEKSFLEWFECLRADRVSLVQNVIAFYNLLKYLPVGVKEVLFQQRIDL